MVWNKSESKPYFFLKLTLKHELIMDFLENSGIPVYHQKIERIGFQTTNGHVVGDSVYPFSHHHPPPHHHQTSPTIINHPSTNIITIASESMCQNHEISKELPGEITASRCYPGCWRWYREPPPRSRDRLRHVFYCLWIGFINNQQEPRTNLNHLLLYGESLLAWWIETPWYLAINIGQQNLKL